MALVEKRYAQAFFDIALKSGNIDNYEKQLSDVVNLYDTSDELRIFLAHPKYSIKQKKEVLKKIFSEGLDRETQNFILLLNDKRRIEMVHGVYDEYCELRNKMSDTLGITVISAKDLDTQQTENIKEKYKKLYNVKNIILELKKDENLLGGVKVIVGDKCDDGSLSGKLGRLKELLLAD